jgi:hypothetical protein
MLPSLLVSAVSCAPTETGQKQLSDPTKISQIQKGVSTKANIKAAFGDPEGIDFEANGDEVWTYSYSKSSINPANLIPVVDIVHHADPMQFVALTVSFDNRGLVKAYSVQNHKYGQPE